jgi:hypothetical protein
VKNASPMGRIRLASLGGAPDTPRAVQSRLRWANLPRDSRCGRPGSR